MRRTVLIVGAATLTPIWVLAVTGFFWNALRAMYLDDGDWTSYRQLMPSAYVLALFLAAIGWTVGTLSAVHQEDVAYAGWGAAILGFAIASWQFTWLCIVPALFAAGLLFMIKKAVDEEGLEYQIFTIGRRIERIERRLEQVAAEAIKQSS